MNEPHMILLNKYNIYIYTQNNDNNSGDSELLLLFTKEY